MYSGSTRACKFCCQVAAAASGFIGPTSAPLFDGRPALDLMLGGVAGLFLVRAYLDGERGGDFA